MDLLTRNEIEVSKNADGIKLKVSGFVSILFGLGALLLLFLEHGQ